MVLRRSVERVAQVDIADHLGEHPILVEQNREHPITKNRSGTLPWFREDKNRKS